MNVITRNDCEKIIKQEFEFADAGLITFEVVQLGSFLGFLGEYFQLKIEANVDGKIQRLFYFAKSLPVKNQREREIQAKQGFHKKEILIYEQIFTKFNEPKVDTKDAWCPRFVFAKDDVLILEDLAIKGYRTMPFRYEFRQRHIEEALKMMARFHSCSFIYEAKNTKKIGDEFKEILVDVGYVPENPWFQTGLKTIVQIADDLGLFKTYGVKRNFEDSLNEFFVRMYDPTDDIVKVLSNSDAWKNNLMFTFEGKGLNEPNHCVMLDYQVAKYLPLPIDILIIIHTNTRRSHRDLMMKHYLKFYYERLEMELSKQSNLVLSEFVTFQKFIKSCEYFKLVAMIFHAFATMIHLTANSIFAQMSVEDYEKFMLNDRFSFVKKMMEDDSVYCERVTEAVTELSEYLNLCLLNNNKIFNK